MLVLLQLVFLLLEQFVLFKCHVFLEVLVHEVRRLVEWLDVDLGAYGWHLPVELRI